MLKKQLCPNCGNRPMSWAKKLFGLNLRCKSCGEKLRHDVLWSFATLIIFASIACFLMRYISAAWVVMPVLAVASLVIIATPLKQVEGH